MSKRHQPTPEEIADFHAAVADATPLKKPARVAHERPKPVPRPRQRELDEAAAIVESLHGPFEIDDLLAIAETDSFLRTGLSRSKDVLAFCHAPPNDGGEGALWILLRATGRS